MVLAKIEVCNTALGLVRKTVEKHPDSTVAELAILQLDVPHGLSTRCVNRRWDDRADDPALQFRRTQGHIFEYNILPVLFAQRFPFNFQESFDLYVHESAVVLEVFPKELIPNHLGHEKSK